MSSEVEDAARVSSTDALRFHLVAPGGTVDFAPTYTHQIFEDETIVGYDDPTVDVFCCASTLATFVRIEGDTAAAASSATAEEPAAPTDIMKCLVENDGLPQKGAIATRSAFDDAVRQSSAFVPPGERVGSFRARAPRWSSGGAQGSGGDAEYTIWRAQPGRCTAAERLQIDRLQTLALYLIDGSSYVDFESPAWTVYSAYCAGPGGGGGSGGAGGGGCSTELLPRRVRDRAPLYAAIPPRATHIAQGVPSARPTSVPTARRRVEDDGSSLRRRAAREPL